MPENEITVVPEVDETQKYVDAINTLKNTTVSREQYDKLRDENKTLLESLVNGRTYETSSTEETAKPSAKELNDKLNKLSKTHSADLEFMETSLAYRDAYIEEFGKDPWCLTGKDSTPTQLDYEDTEQHAQLLKEIIEIAAGNEEVFKREFNRRMSPGRVSINSKLRK